MFCDGAFRIFHPYIHALLGKANGSLTQYKPDLKEAKTIAPPSVDNAKLSIVSILWVSTYQFLVVFENLKEARNRPGTKTEFYRVSLAVAHKRKVYEKSLALLLNYGLMFRYHHGSIIEDWGNDLRVFRRHLLQRRRKIQAVFYDASSHGMERCHLRFGKRHRGKTTKQSIFTFIEGLKTCVHYVSHV